MYTLIGQYVVYIGCSAFHGNGFFHQILFRRGKHPAEREATDRNRKYYHTTIYKMTTQNKLFWKLVLYDFALTLYMYLHN